MSMLTELRARKKAMRNTEKKLYSLGTEPSKPTEVPFEGYEGAPSRESQFFLQFDQSTAPPPPLAQEQESTQASTTANTAGEAVEPAKAVTESLPTRIEVPEPAQKDRLCYECQHFQRSLYGYPLGLCRQHGNRIQHSTSQPAQFGCGEFTFRQTSEDSKTCLECRNYNPDSTMCRIVNTGCPYPSIPPCSGEKFQRKLQVIKSNKESS